MNRDEGPATHARIAAAMREPSFYDPQPETVDTRETHVSSVFLAGDRVYKLKRPVVLPFADLGTVERRRMLCEEEVRLNRRLAPDVYLGVREVVERGGRLALGEPGDPAALEPVVEMRRLDERRSLDALLERGEAGEEVMRAVAERLAAFHADAAAVAPARALAALDESIAETFATLAGSAGRELADAVAGGARFARAFVAGRRGELRARAESGFARDCHGDLRAEHVFVDAGGIRVIDCAELEPRMREIDVGADLSFLVMDLELRGRRELATALVGDYRAAGGDPGPDAQVWFHAAQRAWVRAKVALLSDDARAGDAGRLAALARRLQWRAREPLVLVVCGPAAVGKTTLARAIGERCGVPVASSDVVRKRAAGLAPSERGGEDLYTRERSRATYAELGRLAAAERIGVVDATFRLREDRDAFRAALGPREAVFVECSAPDAVVAERARARERDPERVSDASAAVAARLEWEALAEVPAGRHAVVRTDRAVDEALAEVEKRLDSLL